MNDIINTRNMPEWINAFAVTLGEKNLMTKEAATTAINNSGAEINLNELPKVVWNDETFFINFVNGGAQIYNKFGNPTTFFPELKTVEEVSQELSGQQVVNASLETEILKTIGKVAANDDVNNDDEDTTADNSIATATNNDGKEVESSAEKTASLDEALRRIAELEQQVANISQQLYARTNPGDIYHIDVQPVENNKFAEEAAQTEQQIANDAKLDITTPKGRTVDYLEHNKNKAAYIALDAEATENFKNENCPCCASKNKMKITAANSKTTTIVCKQCKNKFKVDMNTEKIYKRK